MPNDPVPFSTSGHVTPGNHPAGAPESTVKYYKCSHCKLSLKSKVYLFDHLTKVHGLDVDSALKSAGLKHADSSSSSSRAGDSLKACSGGGLKECSKKEEKSNLKGDLTISENSETKITVMSENTHNKDAETKEHPTVASKKSGPDLSDNVNTCKRTTQTITKFLVATPGTIRESPDKSADGSQETLLLQESPTSSGQNNRGVFQLSAKPSIDVPKYRPHCSLKNDPLLSTKIEQANAKKESAEEVPNNVGKRTREDSSVSCSVKKAKLDQKVTEKENMSQHQSSSDFSFEVSGDESEKRANPAHADPAVFFCKHCDYSDDGVRRMKLHYRSDHPYITCNGAYIQDSSDTSATFRCLQCPVEFLSVALLKRHYRKHHPDGPDVFTLKSSELCLGFRCFQCLFTTTSSETLREHYSEEHQTHKVGNSLLFYRYSMMGSQKIKCEEESEEFSAENACTPPKGPTNTTLPQQPDGVLNKCNICTFSHKSVVVMHVHYQRSHPEEAMTLDKIKQLARASSCATALTMAGKPTSPRMSMGNSKSLRSSVDSLQMVKDKGVFSPQQEISVSSDSSPSHLQSRQKRTEESVKYQKKTRKSSSKSNSETPPDEGLLANSSNLFYYCQLCNYKNAKLKSVVGHQNAKHFMFMKTNDQRIIKYSAAMRGQADKEKAAHPKSSSSPRSATSKEAAVDLCEAEPAADVSQKRENPYAHPENLFYCLRCHYANPAPVGVLNHQAKLHAGLKISIKRILRYSALIQEKIKKSKTQTNDSPFSSHLPLPLLNESDRLKLFCHLCNYRQSTMSMVLKHCSTSHHGFKVQPGQIHLYTSFVLDQTQVLPDVKAKVKQEPDQETVEDKAKKLPTASSPVSVGDARQERTLRCRTCSFSTQYVYILKRHLLKSHSKDLSVTEVLNECFKQGSLQAGYHCELCGFHSENPAAVYEHYTEQHPGRKLSLEHVKTVLHAGIQMSPDQKMKLEATHSDDESRGDGSQDVSASTRRRAETYPCSECFFRGDSILSITRHFRDVHPWSKDDGEVQGLKEKPFDAYQVPLEFDPATCEGESTPAMFKCSYCPAVLNTQRGLNTHCGLKHQDVVNRNAEPGRKVSVRTRVHVFKCPNCTYVNTVYLGVITHCRKRHAELTQGVESLHVDVSLVQNLDGKTIDPGGSWKFSGHVCTICSLIFSAVDQLDRHCNNNHGKKTADGAQSTPKAASKSTALLRQVPKLKISKASLPKKKIYSAIRCQHCPFKCSTNVSMRQHMCAQHSKYTVSKDCVYRCVLCSKVYNRKKHLACHYIMKHGRETYVKHYVPLYKKAPLKATLLQSHSVENASDCGTAPEEQKLVLYRCPCCPYVNGRHHGILTHCQMKHPKFVARADKLQAYEIQLTNMVRCTKGRKSNHRGYMCNVCPQVYGSLSRLSVHCKKDHHSRGMFEDMDEPESSTSVAGDFKEEPLEVPVDSGQQCTPVAHQTTHPESLSTQANTKLYKCHMCSYRGSYRRYLHSHYQKTHKLETQTTLKLLQRYNVKKTIPKPPSRPEEAEPEERVKDTCGKCPDLTFDSSQELLDHYHTVHRAHCKLDFIVLSTGERHKTTGLYKCRHCKKQLNGTKKLHIHLDNHRRQMKAPTTVGPSPQSAAPTVEPGTPHVVHGVEPMEESIPNTPADWSDPPVRPAKSPSKLGDVDQPELKNNKYMCKQCRRSFMSWRGLRTHENSHAAVAAIKKLNVSIAAPDSSFTKYMSYKTGHTRPFVCSVCSYRTTVMGLWWSHFLKNHQDVILNSVKTDDDEESSAERSNNEPHDVFGQIHSLDDPDKQPEEAKSSLYLEPPDVRRQLNHYSVMAQRGSRAEVNVHEPKLPEDSLLHCDMCNFTTEHSSSIRRHYMNRHGKKILRCKDCSFFTGSRKTLELHMKMGHSTYQSRPTHQKDLRCPFCLYQTKNKNNMIDHITLHREERVVPMEVRRSKLSRYLQGVVFRCHKCTFTSGSAESLRVHMGRHDDVRPYRCRLCFFDCTQLSDLEEHLSDKHQVLRNHELVGQVSLEQLDERVSRAMDMEEEPLFISEHCSNHSEDVEMMEELLTDCSDLAQDQNGGTQTSEPDHTSSCTYSQQEKHKLHMKEQRMLKIEDDILQDILFLDEDSGLCRTHKDAETHSSHLPPLNEQSRSSTPIHNLELSALAKISETQANKASVPKSPVNDVHPRAASPNVSPKQPELSREDGQGVSFPTCKQDQEDQERHRRSSEDVLETSREMPVLENEYLKQERPLYTREGDHSHPEQEVEEEADGSSEGGARSCEEQDGPTVLQDEKRFTCEFCGRILESSSELQRHTVRHRM